MTSILGLKGQRSVSFHLHFAHLTIPLSFSFSFFHTVPVRCPLSRSVFPFLSIASLFLSPPPRYSSFPVLLSFLSFVLTYPSPLLLTLPSPYPPLLFLLPYSLFSKLPLSSPTPPPPPLPPPPSYSFAYKFPLRINFFFSSDQGSPHELAVIFVDNSGVDIILGMFPFVRELLSRGTKVKLLRLQLRYNFVVVVVVGGELKMIFA